MKATNQGTGPGRPKGLSKAEMQCVGYLTRSALLDHLRRLKREGKIGHWWAVEHPADEDASKPHWHLRLTPPPSRAVDWAAVAAEVVEEVDGEPAPRRLVLGKRAVNDESEEGLLYARHDSRYCAAKGLHKSTMDYPPASFLRDDDEWFDGLWKASDEYEPTAKRMTKADLLDLLERNPRLPRLDLLRLCISNGFSKGDFDLLEMYRREFVAAKESAPAPAPRTTTPDEDPDAFLASFAAANTPTFPNF